MWKARNSRGSDHYYHSNKLLFEVLVIGTKGKAVGTIIAGVL